MKAFALIGQPLGHSLSPGIHALISEITGLPCTYALQSLTQDEVQPFIRSLRERGLDGLNVTIPYKLDALRCMDGLSREAEAAGAVNTVEIAESSLIGHNTDVHGFGALISAAGIEVAGKRCAVLGSGGSARAVVACLLGAGVSDVVVASRNVQEAASRFPGIRAVSYEELESMAGGLLVNCTPLGMHPRPEGCPAPECVVGNFEAVADLVYNPRPTRLLQIAARLGLKCADGLYMLAAQAVKAREIWHKAELGEAVEREVQRRMETGLDKILDMRRERET